MAQATDISAANKALIDAVAGALGGFVSTAVMNPISVLVQGLQVDQVKSKDHHDRDSSDLREEGAFEILQNIIKNQGVAGLFSGMLPAATKQLITSYLFYWWYSIMKAPVQRLSNRAGPVAAMLVNLLHGTFAGCATQLAVLPLEMVVTRIHARILELPPSEEYADQSHPNAHEEQTSSLESTPGEITEPARLGTATATTNSAGSSSPSSVSQSPSSASASDSLGSSGGKSSGRYKFGSSCSSSDHDHSSGANQRHGSSNHQESAASAVASAIRAIYAEGGIGNFWTSIVPALLICFNPGLMQFLQLQLRNGRMPENLSLAESAWHGALSKLIAMVVTYPLSTVKTVMQTAPATQDHSRHSVGGEGAGNEEAKDRHEAVGAGTCGAATLTTTPTPAGDNGSTSPPSTPLHPSSEKNQITAFVACVTSIVHTRGVAGLYRGIGPSLLKKGLGEAILSVVRDKTGWLFLFCLANFQLRQKQQKLTASPGVPLKATS